MRLALAEPRYLKDSIAIISDIVNEARLKVTKDAIELVAMDPANVAMVIFKLLSSAFTEYKVDKPVEIGVNLNNVKQILRRVKPSDMLILELADNKLKIQMKSETTRTFNLPLIDIEEREQKIPELSFAASIETTSLILNDAIEDVDIVAESVSFVAEPKRFSLQATGDLSSASIEMREDDTTKIKTKEKVRAKYSVEYLKKMIQGGKLSDRVAIHFNKDYPLKLDYHAVDRVMLSFILAPRVESE